ncbi:MAG: tyrosine--tRNA ligase, partial [archaeon]
MQVDEKLELITRNLEEVLTIEDLRKMLEEKAKLNHYIGFEISGKIHLGSGLATSLKIK